MSQKLKLFFRENHDDKTTTVDKSKLPSCGLNYACVNLLEV